MIVLKRANNMSYLSHKTKRSDYRLVGASMPLQVFNYLTLYALLKGESKTKILIRLVQNWIENGATEESLIQDITEKIQEEWNRRKTKYTKLRFADYMTGVKNELRKKGLDLCLIEQIVINIQQEDGTDKENDTPKRSNKKESKQPIKRKT